MDYHRAKNPVFETLSNLNEHSNEHATLDLSAAKGLCEHIKLSQARELFSRSMRSSRAR